MAHQRNEPGLHLIRLDGSGEGSPKLPGNGGDHDRGNRDRQNARQRRGR